MPEPRDSGLPPRSGSFRAVVCAGTTVTSYLRAGAGRPVLLLRPAEGAAILWDRIVATISGSLRVIVPDELPEGAPGDWLAAFLDALGIEAVAVVADGALAGAAVAMAADAPERVSRTILLGGATSASQLGELPQPVLLLPAEWDAERAVGAMVRFLAGEPEQLG